ncbi:MAG: acyl-CoA thioesterase, partial [Giesbergeria sp.]|nr:acyl-CoA thioesterase [Giesbergeria sp.]
MQRADFRCLHRLRVRWAEVDLQKIVFNAHYLAYFDIALMDYWRALALPYEDGMSLLGGEVLMKKSTLEYHHSARLDDVLDIGLRCDGVGTSSMRFSAAIFCGQRLLVSGELVYVFAELARQRARPVPPPLRAML